MVSQRAPFASNWTKSFHESLAKALGGAWRNHNRNYSVDNITYEQKVVISNTELPQAFAEMDNLLRIQPKLSHFELAEQVIAQWPVSEPEQKENQE